MELKYLKIKEYLKAEALKPQSKQHMPTVRELMRLFGVSQAPVSRALKELEFEGIINCRQGSGIRSIPQTKPDLAYLSKAAKGKILFITVDVFVENIWQMTHIVSSYCIQKRVELQTYRLTKNTDLLQLLRHGLEKSDFSGVIILPGANSLKPDAMCFLESLKIPVVLLDSNFLYQNAPENLYMLLPDPKQGRRLCVQELLENGHRKIAYIRNEAEVDVTHLMLEAITEACREGGAELFYFSSTIRCWDNAYDFAVKILAENMEKIRRLGITALIFTTGTGAISASAWLQDNGIRVPEDFSVVSCGDFTVMRYIHPQLTIADCDYAAMSCDAVNLILSGGGPHKTVMYPYHLIRRKSILNKKERIS